MDTTTIARLVHELNRAYCQTLGDNSQLEWDKAPDWQKDSCINGVKFHIANPNAEPEASHENWLLVKKAEGWKYGPIKDVNKKEHPCFLPYKELPVHQQIKDHLLRNIVHTLMPFYTP